MADQLEMQQAKAVYEVFCNALKEDDWSFMPADEKLSISLGIKGENLNMDLGIIVGEKRQSVTVGCALPFTVIEDRRMEMAIAVCMANHKVACGLFDYDISDGTILFRLVHCFNDCPFTKDLARSLIGRVCSSVDHYYDRLRALGTGVIDLERFLELESKDE